MAREAEVLDLPRTTGEITNVNRRVTYRPKTENTAIIDFDGREVTSYVKFSAARLVRLSMRNQEVKDREDDNQLVTRLVLTMGVILDDLEVGLIDDKGHRLIHPMLNEERYTAFKSLPHRVNGQQWMNISDLPRAVSFASHLQDRHRFRIRKSPRNPEDSERTTTDLFRASPIDPLDRKNPSSFGVQLEAFEISVNPLYKPGFESFWHGLTENQNRWEQAAAETDPQLRKEGLEALVSNVHFVGGTYYQDERHRHWARPVDIGMIQLDGTQFPFYPVSGDLLDVNDLMHEIFEEGEATPAPKASGVAPPVLSLPVDSVSTSSEDEDEEVNAF